MLTQHNRPPTMVKPYHGWQRLFKTFTKTLLRPRKPVPGNRHGGHRLIKQ